MAPAVVGDDHRVGARLRAQLGIFAGHDALCDHRQGGNRLDPLQVLPGGRRVSPAGVCARSPADIAPFGTTEIDAAKIAVAVADVALALGRPLGIQSEANRLVARILGAPEPVLGHFFVAERV